MALLLKFFREGLGRIIVFIDWISRPRKLQRAPEAQAQIQATSQTLALYQYYACPFCVRTRRAMHRLNLPIETRDVRKNAGFRKELLNGGGRIKTPCLRIEEKEQVHWLYDSKEIINYLHKRFGGQV